MPTELDQLREIAMTIIADLRAKDDAGTLVGNSWKVAFFLICNSLFEEPAPALDPSESAA